MVSQVPTEIPWIDAAVERSGLPPMADLEGGLMIYNQVACDSVGVHTFRRYDIPYKRIGRTRRYVVDDIIAFARKRFEEAPVLRPAERRPWRRKNISNTTATGTATLLPPKKNDRRGGTQRPRNTAT
jgi:hypothetical protein